MTRRELLQDRYEDARFALLMDEIAAAEDRWAQRESHRLNADGAAGIPEDLDRRCRQTIRRARTRRHLRSAGRFAAKTLKRVALAAGIAAILFTTAFALSETVRANTMNLIIQVFETNTAFSFSGKADDETLWCNVGWVPEGYVLVDRAEDWSRIRYEYRNNENTCISISCRKAEGLSIGIDTEDAEVTHIEVKGCPAMLIKKGSEFQVAWAAKDNTRFITIVGFDISREDILHIADELNY